MTLDQLITNVRTLVEGALPSLTLLCAVSGTALYAGGKALDSPRTTAWGKNAWIGAIIAAGGTVITTLLQGISGAIF